MFDDMAIAEVVWDEELQHMCDDQHGLLKELAQAGCHAGDNRFMFKAPVALNRLVHEVPSQVVWDEEHLQSPNSEDDLLLLLSEPATLADHVEFMDHVTSGGDAHEVFATIHSDREATSLTDEGAFYSCKVSESAVVEVLNIMPLPNVIWDEEPHHGPKSEGLLLQLASGGEMLHNAISHAGLLQKLASCSNELDVPNKLVQQEVVFGECLVFSNDRLTHGSDMDTAEKLFEDMPLEVVWDEEMPSNIGTQGSVVLTSVRNSGLQDVLTDVGNFTISADPSMQVSDQLCKFALASNAYLLEMQWNPRILDYDNMRLGSRREFLAGILLHELMLQELYAKGISLKRTNYRCFIASCNPVNQIMIHEENIPSSFSSQVTLLALEDIPAWNFYGFNLREHEQLTQLAYDGKYLDDTNPQLIRDELLADGDNLTSITELGLDVGNFGLEETLGFYGLDIDRASNQTFKEADENLQLEGHFLGTFRLWQEYGMDVAEQTLELMHKPVNLKSPVLSKCAQYGNQERSQWRQSTLSSSDDMTAARSMFHHILAWNPNDASPWSLAWLSIVGLQTVSKYDLEKMICSGCLNVPWDPGGNHSCFALAIAWGQAMFCGGGNVMPGTIEHMGWNIIGFGPSRGLTRYT